MRLQVLGSYKYFSLLFGVNVQTFKKFILQIIYQILFNCFFCGQVWTFYFVSLNFTYTRKRRYTFNTSKT